MHHHSHRIASALALVTCVTTFPHLAGAGPAPTPSREVIVEVNGTGLTRAEADLEVVARMTQVTPLPSNQLETARSRMLDGVIERFIVRSLLSQEADRRGIALTPQEEAAAFDRIRENLPKNTALDDILKKSPRGEAAMRAEILSSVRIEKLLEQASQESSRVSDREVDDFRTRHKNEIAALPETAHARHIRIAIAKDDSPAVRAEKRVKADKIRNDLLSGGDFAEFARKYSDCPSRQLGGDLGTIPRDKLVREFGDAVFGQNLKEIGPVIEVPTSGFHIVQVLERHPAGSLSPAEIVDMIRKQKRQDATRSLVESLRKKAVIRDYRTMAAPAPESK